MEKEANGVNPTLMFLLSNKAVINIILLAFSFLLIILIIIVVINRWVDKDLIINVILMIIGSFLGASLLKYGLKK